MQGTDPLYQGGANCISLMEHQAALLCEVPLSIREHLGFRREPTWQPHAVGERSTSGHVEPSMSVLRQSGIIVI